MYVSYLLDKDTEKYSNSVTHPTQTLNSQNLQYTDFSSYHDKWSPCGSPDLTSILPPGQELFHHSTHEKKLVRLNQTQCTFIQYRREDAQQGQYSVVYTDQQCLELEKEWQYSRYITIRRKTELALGLSLSERQVQIWFQNTKERKITKKIQLYQQASKTSATLTLTLSSLADPGNNSMATSFNSSRLLSETISIKEEY
uniref:Homeobox domain-containing protein n=1 Tax=Oncorhynchus kisutch TaxID=8019 RepID=A0A8C7DUG1_ONCKI